MTMTNTIPNVPRELLRDIETHLDNIAEFDPTYAPDTVPLNTSAELLIPLRALLSAPSPAGVDGLEVVGWYRMDDRKAITPYPSVCATWHKMGVKVGAAYSDSAHVIIDGLRGEVERLQFSLEVAKTDELSAAVYAETESIKHSLWDAEKERDQQAQRIGELEGLLLRVQVSLSLDDTEWGYSGAEKYKLLADIRAALSAGKERE